MLNIPFSLQSGYLPHAAFKFVESKVLRLIARKKEKIKNIHS